MTDEKRSPRVTLEDELRANARREQRAKNSGSDFVAALVAILIFLVILMGGIILLAVPLGWFAHMVLNAFLYGYGA
jgi:hypothetical protein